MEDDDADAVVDEDEVALFKVMGPTTEADNCARVDEEAEDDDDEEELSCSTSALDTPVKTETEDVEEDDALAAAAAVAPPAAAPAIAAAAVAGTGARAVRAAVRPLRGCVVICRWLLDRWTVETAGC